MWIYWIVFCIGTVESTLTCMSLSASPTPPYFINAALQLSDQVNAGYEFQILALGAGITNWADLTNANCTYNSIVKGIACPGQIQPPMVWIRAIAVPDNNTGIYSNTFSVPMGALVNPAFLVFWIKTADSSAGSTESCSFATFNCSFTTFNNTCAVASPTIPTTIAPLTVSSVTCPPSSACPPTETPPVSNCSGNSPSTPQLDLQNPTTVALIVAVVTLTLVIVALSIAVGCLRSQLHYGYTSSNDDDNDIVPLSNRSRQEREDYRRYK